jgi:hypothetical protein
MAQTTGLVQRINISPDLTTFTSAACVWIGPTISNVELLMVFVDNNDPSRIAIFRSGLVDALVSAMVNRHEIVAFHGDSDSIITDLRIEPS